MKNDLCIEWRECGMHSWSYMTGTRGKSREELARWLTTYKADYPQFEFRIQPFDLPQGTYCSPLEQVNRKLTTGVQNR